MVYLPIVPAFLFFTVLGVLGVAGNIFILSTHYRVPDLRQVFVAALAMTDLLTCTYFSAGPYFLVAEQNITQTECVYRCAPQLFGVSGSNQLCLLLGFDRLASVFFPMMYQTFPMYRRVVIAGICGVGIPSGMVLLAWASARSDYMTVFCNLPNSLGGPAFSVFMGSSLIINITVIIVYITVFLKMKFGSTMAGGGSAAGQKNWKTMTQSLLIIAFIQIFTWFLTAFISLALPASGLEEQAISDIMLYLGISVVFNHACNGYVYLWRSKEYRKAFMTLKHKTSSNKVVSIDPVHLSTNANNQAKSRF